jgi:DNA replication protein DnaC
MTTAVAKKSSDHPPLEIDATRERLAHLGLAFAAESLGDELAEAVKHNRAAHVVLDRLLTREVAQRDERRVKTSLRLSNLPPGMTLGNFDFAFQPSIDRRQIETLATGAFIREASTLLLQGAPGVGKTHLAVALGVKAIEQGFSVAFYRLEDLLYEMRKDAHVWSASSR